MRELFSVVAMGIVSSTWLGGAAGAAPITLDKTNSVADARLDAGSGVCASATQFKTQATPLNTVSDAQMLLDKPATDPAIIGRRSAIFDNLNFRNGNSGAGGDFTIPMYPDTYLPYSANSAAMPPDLTPSGDQNIAVRIRGYLNVTDTLGGQPVTFALNCDDFCSLSIGKKSIIPLAHLQIAGRIAQQVIFKDNGLYPIEIVFAQNSNAAFLELSRALSAEPEGPQSSPVDPNKFGLIPGTALYSAIVGSSAGCQECGAPGMDCSAGDYCGDGLCQMCNVADHCGSACITCPAGARICSAGQCVECASTADCAMGQLCDTATGHCKKPVEGIDGGTDGGGMSVGCQCQTAGGQGRRSRFWLLLAALGALGATRRLWLRRRPSSPASRTACRHHAATERADRAWPQGGCWRDRAGASVVARNIEI